MAKKKKPEPIIQPRLLNIRQAAQYLSTTVWFLRRAAWAKKIPVIRLGHRYCFPIEELDAFVDREKATAGIA